MVPSQIIAGYKLQQRQSPSDLWRKSISELASLISTRKVSVREVIQAHLLRIQTINPRVNAVTELLSERALAEAESYDRRHADSRIKSPLLGIPFSVKTNIDLAGSATTEGVRALINNVPAQDSPHVAFMREAGAIAIARTNMPDFGLRYHTDNDLYGATVNPWNSEVTPGGSSGGDAVAVATGMVPLGLGNDFGGSIRYPAQCCGVCGLRPSRGRIPSVTQSTSRGNISHSLMTMAVQGLLARSIGDLRIGLKAVSRSDVRDPNWMPMASFSKLKKPFRIGIIENPAGLGLDDSVLAGIRRSASIVEEMGGSIEGIDSSGLRESANLWLELIATDIRILFLNGINELASPAARKFVADLLRLNGDANLDRYVQSLARINGIAQTWALTLQKYDAIIGPVSTRNPFKVGFDVANEHSAKAILDSQILTVTINLLGLPSVAVPVGIHDGIPQSVQIVGPRFHEGVCLDLAEAIEKQVGILTPIDPMSKGH